MKKPVVRWSDGEPNFGDLDRFALWFLKTYGMDLSGAAGRFCSTARMSRFMPDAQDSVADAEAGGLCEFCDFQKRCPHEQYRQSLHLQGRSGGAA